MGKHADPDPRQAEEGRAVMPAATMRTQGVTSSQPPSTRFQVLSARRAEPADRASAFPTSFFTYFMETTWASRKRRPALVKNEDSDLRPPQMPQQGL